MHPPRSFSARRRLLSVAVLTDADNTQQQAQAWYGPIEIRALSD